MVSAADEDPHASRQFLSNPTQLSYTWKWGIDLIEPHHRLGIVLTHG